MKQTIIMAAAVLLSLGATVARAQVKTDTLVLNNVERVKIETRDTLQRIVISGTKDDPDFHYVQRIAYKNPSDVRRTISNVKDFNKITITKKGKKSKWDTELYAQWGINMMTGVPDGYDFKVWPSFEWGLGILFDYYPNGKKNAWSTGLLLNWHNYRLASDSYLQKDTQDKLVSLPYAAAQTERRSQLQSFSLTLPLIYTHYFSTRRTWGFSLGALVNFNTSAYAHRTFEFDGEEYDVKTKKIGQRPVTIDGLLQIHTPTALSLYVKYSPTTFFKNDRGPECHQLSFGICL